MKYWSKIFIGVLIVVAAAVAGQPAIVATAATDLIELVSENDNG